jgi:nicotinate-nucleotide pyrophosphorylase (carboxylating)
VSEPLDPAAYRDLVARALVEDLGAGDVTTRAVVPSGVAATGTLLVKRACVIAGLDVARETFAQVDAATVFTTSRQDGDLCDAHTTIATVEGPAAALLTAERTALNFLQHLSGIASLTRRFVDAAGGTLAVLDTRKTVPGLRALAKYAVRCGGGTNHRFGLFDGVLVKDNHIRLAGSIQEAVRRVRAAGLRLPIEVEVQSLEEVERALSAGADVIMLDNLDTASMKRAIARIGGLARVEISGGVTLDRMPALAALGANCVSVGAITHSAPAADICFEFET